MIVRGADASQKSALDYGNRFLIANGYLGYRGTLEEDGADACVACNLCGVYDGAAGKWRESVNAPNPLAMRLTESGDALDARKDALLLHELTLDTDCAVLSRRTVFRRESGSVTVASRRFASAANPKLLCLEYAVSSDYDADLLLDSGIDGEVWDTNGPHLIDFICERGEVIVLSCRLQESGRLLSVGERMETSVPLDSFVAEEKKIFRRYVWRAQAGETYTFRKICAVAVDAPVMLPEQDFETLEAAHRAIWVRRWADAAIRIEGDDTAQDALAYSVYHLLSLTPAGVTSIPARGLSGQTYKGAIFWDTEIFMLPFFLSVDPAAARKLVEYRIRTLSGAKRKALSLGFEGAYYAWESQETGDEACSRFNVTDAITGRPVRTYFADKQIHIDGDIVYAILSYVSRTGDESILAEGGAEVIAECARFYCSYAHYSPYFDRTTIDDVIGPDEYHERVNNNAFTNRLVRFVWDEVENIAKQLKRDFPKSYEETDRRVGWKKLLGLVRELKAKLPLPAPNADGVIEQFDGYFSLEDCGVGDCRARLAHPNEYWGGANGVASQTQVIKQADVITMLYLFDEYPIEVARACYEYYFPRTEHGSSLSASMYAMIACRLGYTEDAYRMMMKTATVDLTGDSKQYAGGVYIGGTHPAASGGAYMTAVFGFGGLKFRDGIPYAEPKLPARWHKLTFQVRARGKRYEIIATKDGATVKETEES